MLASLVPLVLVDATDRCAPERLHTPHLSLRPALFKVRRGEMRVQQVISWFRSDEGAEGPPATERAVH